ncbi:ATP-dependent RecD-like DNA helicase [Lacrimispora xylanolytica]
MDEEKILKFECTLDWIIFPKYVKKVESNEFAIFRANISKALENCSEEMDQIKLKGNTCSLEFGTTYKVFCKLADVHEHYGNTYEIVYISKSIDISSKDKQKEFLKNVLNENLVDKLFDEYDDVIKLLEERDVKSLMKIKGIGNQVALKMIDEFEESKDYSAIYMELGQLGLTHTFIKKLVDFYHSPDTVIDVVRNNPYDLVRVEGVGFKKADEVACKVGVGQYDIRRIKGFLQHYLNEQGELGKSYLNYQELMKALYDTLGFVPEEVVNSTAKLMIENNDVVVLDNGTKIALKKFYDLENRIMSELIRLQIGKVEIIETEDDKYDSIVPESELHMDYIPKSFNIGNWESIVSRVEDEQGFIFTNEQRAAIKLSLDNHVMALTGLAGAGKTSTANGICSLYDNYNILACALSGKASVRITEATGLPASTIHRALGYQNGQFMFNKLNKLAVDIVLIDEATMINGTLFLSLLEAIPSGAKVIIMGDVQQLTPIGNCQVFADILDSNVLPVVKLTKPHRQALMSGIIPTSIKVASQEQIFTNSFDGNVVLGELKDMELDITGNKESLPNSIIRHFQCEMEKYKDIMEVQVCVPMRLKGELSCYYINTKIQDIYNPKFNDGNEIEILLEKKKENVKKYLIRVGDKVLNTKNNYKCINSNGDNTPVFNGNIGIIKEIGDDGYCIIDFVGIGEIVFSKSDSKNLELAYACTVHKMQGSGFTSTIVGMDSSSFIMNNSELLYTALTRAKKYCILVGNNFAVSKAIQTKEVKTKQTFLRDMLLENKFRLKEKEEKIA